MTRFLLRSVISTFITMVLVSAFLFFLLEVAGRNVVVSLLGVFVTPEQMTSYKHQLGLDAPAWQRYSDWLIGNDWRAQRDVGYPLVTAPNAKTGEPEWWADVNGQLTRWKMEKGELFALVRNASGGTDKKPAGDVWKTDAKGEVIFWGIDTNNSAVKWVKGKNVTVLKRSNNGISTEQDGPVDYLPLRKGFLRGDPGMSLQYGRPVAYTLFPRIRNTLVLAAFAFIIVMPLALLLGIIAGVNAGRPTDRFISISGLAFTATPEFVTGIFLILILGIWLKWLPPTAVFLNDSDIYNLKLIALPVLTLTAVELGYVVRMTRASMVEVMDSPYIRTAIIKGMPFRRVVIRHALRNALMAPITIIMLHVNWLIGGIVVVEVLFGFPGLGNYIYGAATFGDYNALEAAAMFTVVVAVVTRLLGDLVYTFLNPRIRYA
ncbi:MAG: ABC transporter permease [Caldilineaceae bacterium]